MAGVDGAVISYPGADGGEVGGSSRRERYPGAGYRPSCPRSTSLFVAPAVDGRRVSVRL